VLFFVVALLGWLRDARREYVKTTEADRTGHLENIPAPGWPRRILATFAIVVAVALLIDAGVLFSSRPPAEVPGGGGGAPEACAEPGSAFELVARDIAFDLRELCAAAGTPFTIRLANEDPAGVTHDVDLRGPGGAVLADQSPIDGGQASTYEYDGLAVGEYVFICSIHPIPPMTGALTVR
jgi:plastocyanin